MVANKFLEDVELDDHVRKETIVMCKHFHESVRGMSERYYDILRRYNYVTPTSYLELILTFKKLLGTKRDEILTLKNRYIKVNVKNCKILLLYHTKNLYTRSKS